MKSLRRQRKQKRQRQRQRRRRTFAYFHNIQSRVKQEVGHATDSKLRNRYSSPY